MWDHVLKLRCAGRPPRGGRGLKHKTAGLLFNQIIGRPPRGGRGLKQQIATMVLDPEGVAPRAGGVD